MSLRVKGLIWKFAIVIAVGLDLYAVTRDKQFGIVACLPCVSEVKRRGQPCKDAHALQ